MSRFQTLLGNLPKLQIPVMEKSFTCFSTLPLELREMIWTFVALQGRDIHIFKGTKWQPLSNPNDLLVVHPILLASHESRDTALKYYNAVKEFSTSPQVLSTRLVRTIYLNVDVDNFILDKALDCTELSSPGEPDEFNFSDDEMSKIQNYTFRKDHACRVILVPRNMFGETLKRNSLKSFKVALGFGWERSWRCRHTSHDHKVRRLWSIIHWEQKTRKYAIKNAIKIQKFLGALQKEPFSVEFTLTYAWDPSSQLASFKV